MHACMDKDGNDFNSTAMRPNNSHGNGILVAIVAVEHFTTYNNNVVGVILARNKDAKLNSHETEQL